MNYLTFFMKLKQTKVVTLAATLITFGSLAGGANATTIVTTAGDATTSDVSISFDVTFLITTAGTMHTVLIGAFPEDANRDGVRFTGSNQLLVEVNSIVVTTGFQDLNDGGGGTLFPSGDPAVDTSFIFFDNSPVLSPGDVVRISGTASEGTFQFGNSPNTFSLLPTGNYDIVPFDVNTRAALNQVPEPSSTLLLGIGLLGITIRRRTK